MKLEELKNLSKEELIERFPFIIMRDLSINIFISSSFKSTVFPGLFPRTLKSRSRILSTSEPFIFIIYQLNQQEIFVDIFKLHNSSLEQRLYF